MEIDFGSFCTGVKLKSPSTYEGSVLFGNNEN